MLYKTVQTLQMHPYILPEYGNIANQNAAIIRKNKTGSLQ